MNRTYTLALLSLLVASCSGSPLEPPGLLICNTSSQDGVGVKAGFELIRSLDIDSQGHLLIGDHGRVRRMTPDGVVSTLATKPEDASFSSIIAGPSGSLFAAMGRGVVRLSPSGEATPIAGDTSASAEALLRDGMGQEARFSGVGGLGIDVSGNLYVADSFNHRIRRVAPNGLVSTIAGSSEVGGELNVGGFADGPRDKAEFGRPGSLDVDASGTVYVVDAVNKRIRKIAPDGLVSTLAHLEISDPLIDLAVGPDGHVYVAESYTINRISPSGDVTIFFRRAPDNTLDLGAWMSLMGIAVGDDGAVYVADWYHVMKVTGSNQAPVVMAGHPPVCD